MAAPGPSNYVARRVVDDLVDFSGETSMPKVMKFFFGQQIEDMRGFVTPIDDKEDMSDTLMCLRDDIRDENNKLMELNGFIDMMSYKCCCECQLSVYDAIRNAEYFIIPAYLVSYSYFVYMGPFFILDKLFEVAESPRLVDKMKYVFGRSRGEDESLAGLMRDLFLSLRISLSKKRRLVAELEAVKEVEGAAKCLEHMRVIVAHDAWVTWKHCWDMLSVANSLTMIGNGLFEIYIYTISLKLMSMAALYILDKLAEVSTSSRLQDKMKVVFVQAHGADESFMALMRDLCSALREMVVRDFATLGVLEQLLAGTHIGMQLKASYVAEMEEIDLGFMVNYRIILSYANALNCAWLLNCFAIH
ncbi:hypothetical protein Tco_0829304 [Tanacetum coccineum]